MIVDNLDEDEVIKLSAWRKMMCIIRPDLKSNPWIYDLIFASSSSRIRTPEQFAGDPTITFQEFCECCHSVNLAVVKTFDSSSSSQADANKHFPLTRTVTAAKGFTCWLVLETHFEYILQFLLAIASISTIICNSDKTQVRNNTRRLRRRVFDDFPSLSGLGHYHSCS